MDLRPYQNEALASVRSRREAGIMRQLIVLPTGAGKTVVFAKITSSAAKADARTLILAHRDELITQAAHKLQVVDPSLAFRIGIVKAARSDDDRDVVIASVQTLKSAARIERYLRFGFPRLVIVDEAHHSAAESYQTILRELGCFAADGGPLTIGVTATPQRADAANLGDTWQEVVYARTMLSLMREGYLCDLRGVRVALRGFNASKLKVSRGDYTAASAGEALEDAHAPEHVVAAWKIHAEGRKTIVFTPTVELARQMAAAFAESGVSAAIVSGTTPEGERRRVLADFASGKITVVCNCAVLTEGFDEPTVECIIVARPTKSQPLYVQMVGRGTRTFPGKKDCLIIDVVGVTDRLGLTTLPKMAGLGDDALDADGTPGSLLAAVAEAEEAAGVETAQRELVAREVELFDRGTLAWMQAGNRWVLNAGASTLTLEQSDAGSWRVVERKSGKDGARQVIASDLDIGYAMGTAEERARKLDPRGKLTDKRSAWRTRPASSAQIAAMQRWRIPVHPGLTAGEASDAMTAAAAKADARRARR